MYTYTPVIKNVDFELKLLKILMFSADYPLPTSGY